VVRLFIHPRDQLGWRGPEEVTDAIQALFRMQAEVLPSKAKVPILTDQRRKPQGVGVGSHPGTRRPICAREVAPLVAVGNCTHIADDMDDTHVKFRAAVEIRYSRHSFAGVQEHVLLTDIERGARDCDAPVENVIYVPTVWGKLIEQRGAGMRQPDQMGRPAK
jgi:hypothetical protein